MFIRDKWALGLILALLVLVVAVYSLVPLLSRSQGMFPILSGADGAYYALRLKTALEGDVVISCPFDPSLRSSQTFIPNLMESTWANLIRPWVGTDMSLAMAVTYTVLPVCIFLLFIFFLNLVFQDLALAGWVSFWGVLDPSIYYWKPFLVSQVDPSEPLAYFRYANPMLFQIPFIVAFGSAFHYLLVNRKKMENLLSWQVGLTLVCTGGLLFYVQVFYATFFFGLMVIYSLISALKGKWQSALATALIVVGMTIIGFPEIFKNLSLFVSPIVPEVIYRIGCLVKHRHPYFLFHKGLIGTFIFYQFISWRHWNVRWKFLTASMIAGFVCLNQNLITGLTSQDQHYFRALMVPYVFTMTDIWLRLQDKIKNERIKLILKVCVMTAIVFCFFRGGFKVIKLIQEVPRNADGEYVSRRILKTVQLVKEKVQDPEGLVLANPTFTYDLEILSNVHVYIDDYFYHCIISDDLLFKRWLMLGKSFGWSRDQVSQRLNDFIHSTQLPYWFFGLPNSYTGVRNEYTDENKQSRIQQWLDAYMQSDFAELLQFENKIRSLPRYLLETPGFKANLDLLQKYFILRSLGEVPEEHTRLWELEYRGSK